MDINYFGELAPTIQKSRMKSCFYACNKELNIRINDVINWYFSSDRYAKIYQTIMQSNLPLKQDEIAKALGINKNGDVIISYYLKTLNTDLFSNLEKIIDMKNLGLKDEEIMASLNMAEYKKNKLILASEYVVGEVNSLEDSKNKKNKKGKKNNIETNQVTEDCNFVNITDSSFGRETTGVKTKQTPKTKEKRVELSSKINKFTSLVDKLNYEQLSRLIEVVRQICPRVGDKSVELFTGVVLNKKSIAEISKEFNVNYSKAYSSVDYIRKCLDKSYNFFRNIYLSKDWSKENIIKIASENNINKAEAVSILYAYIYALTGKRKQEDYREQKNPSTTIVNQELKAGDDIKGNATSVMNELSKEKLEIRKFFIYAIKKVDSRRQNNQWLLDFYNGVDIESIAKSRGYSNNLDSLINDVIERSITLITKSKGKELPSNILIPTMEGVFSNVTGYNERVFKKGLNIIERDGRVANIYKWLIVVTKDVVTRLQKDNPEVFKSLILNNPSVCTNDERGRLIIDYAGLLAVKDDRYNELFDIIGEAYYHKLEKEQRTNGDNQIFY